MVDIAEDHKRAVMRALLSGEDVTWTAGGAWRADGEALPEGSLQLSVILRWTVRTARFTDQACLDLANAQRNGAV